MTEPLTAAPSNSNALAKPFRRLRLGTDEDDPSGERQWQLWIPTTGGGRLKITHSGGAKLTLIDKGGEILEQGDGVIHAELGPGKHGRYYVITSDPAGTLRCNLRQTGWSRLSADPRADPLIPYNFYFYPFDSKARDPNDPLIATIASYARTSGEDSARCVAWENGNHAMPPGQQWGGFEGHCHMAAPASAFFELPPEKTSISGSPNVELDREQMKILGMEFFGNYGSIRNVWWMTGWIIDQSKPNDSLGARSVLSYVIPGEPRSPQKMEEALRKCFSAEIAKKRMNDFLAAIGGESKFDTAVTQKLGNGAATFYHALVKHMLMEGHPLCGNMRVTDMLAADPRGVWNHALFYFSAELEETPNSDDELDMTITCIIAGNADHAPPFSEELPAKVFNNIPIPSKDKRICSRWRHKWRIHFDGSGWPAWGDNNQWLSCRGVDGQAFTTELYPPMDLNIVQKSAVLGQSRDETRNRLAARHKLNPDVKDHGNPAVHGELIDRGYMKLHARYR